MDHGKRWSYLQGCRCTPCTTANTDYHRELRHRKQAGEVNSARVQVELVEGKLTELLEEYSIREIARQASTSDTTIRRIIDGQANIGLELASRILALT